MKIAASELATLLQGRVVGDPSALVSNVNGVEIAAAGDVTFVAQEKFFALLPSTLASVVVVDREHAGCRATQIVVPDANLAFAKLVDYWQRTRARGEGGVHARAIVDPAAVIDVTASIRAGAVVGARSRIGARTIISANAVIGSDVVIGSDCLVHPNASLLDQVRLGDRVIIHAGTVIGSDGFGYATDDGGTHHKIPQIGTVVIEDDVEIGANVCVDRARFAETRIGKGTKIDNLVQVAHNVIIGPHCIIVAQAGIAGSSSLGHHVVLAAKVGVAGHVHIGDRAQVSAMSGVSKDLEAGGQFLGIPAIPYGAGQRARVLQTKLPEMHHKLREVSKRLDQIEEELGRRSDARDKT